MYRNLIKPLIDRLIAAILIIVLSPFFMLTILLQLFSGMRGIFFVQSRPGKDSILFDIIKFKTMTDAKNSSGELLSDDQRLTYCGRLIRKLSLDELPQLINVIKGDMSIIGPRPLLSEYLPLYNEYQKRRHELKPGITGWAQVNGRNAISWLQKFEYDIWYVDNISLWLDLKILWMTIVKVIRRKDISSRTGPTMEKFRG